MFAPAISPTMTAIAVAVLLLIAFGGGFAVSSWRSGEKLEKIRGQNQTLANANDECAEDIANAQNAIKQIEVVASERARKAAEAVKQAQTAAKTHKGRIVQIKAMPAVKPEAQCLAIEREQAAYVASRRDD